MNVCHAKAALITIAFACVFTSFPCNAAENQTRVKLILDWKPGAEHSFVYLRKFFSDEKLDVVVIPGQNSSDSLAQVNAQSVDFGICSGETALIAAAARDPRRVIMLASFYWTTPSEIFSLKEKGIEKPEDLLGKRVGVIRGSSGYRNYTAFIRKAGLDLSRINEVSSTGDVRELISPNVELDAMVQFYYQEPLRLKLIGYKLNEIRFSNYGVQVYGQGLITHSDTIKRDSELVRRFTRAIQRSWQATLANPQDAATAFLLSNPGQNEEYSNAKMKEVGNFVRWGMQEAGVRTIGEQTTQGWLNTYKYLKELVMIETDIDPHVVWTNDFLDNAVTLP